MCAGEGESRRLSRDSCDMKGKSHLTAISGCNTAKIVVFPFYFIIQSDIVFMFATLCLGVWVNLHTLQ